ncbi:HAD family hydrolase [Marinobacterium sp. AK62]|uniref:HAD family hydrolase n=1 Tax=Marinobacterium alkalitolerans TaxID=1542925 RepID=A0ABS3Z7P8_9GAMM|nr:HAD family hydrolase [Marinobacterium alkalitolerans]MBP0047263.1 HAD family hydrolase [Marinobacterium alkalitolerans]
MKHIQGIIFDLDGTLVSSSLNFRAIKQEIGCPPEADVLTFLEGLPEHKQQAAMAVIHRHEQRDAEQSDWIPGAKAFVDRCDAQGIPMAIVTRNSEQSTRLKMARNDIPIERVVTREQSKPKPDPDALLQIARDFALPAQSMLMVGDYRYDLEAGRNAHMSACLVNFTELPDYAHLADYTFQHFGLLHRAMFGPE